jgi:hypothetical protein
MNEITLNTQKYQFADCPKCGRRRPISPVSGLCWQCGGHDAEMVAADRRHLSAEGRALTAVDPGIKATLNIIDRRISEALSGNGTSIEGLRALIAEREALENKM